MNYRPRKEHELSTLSDDDLVAHIVAARKAGDLPGLKLSLGILGFRRWEDTVRRVLAKVPPADAEDVASQALEGAIKAAFEGESMGEFVNLLHTVTDRRIADYHRKLEGKPRQEPLPDEHEKDEDVWGVAGAEPDFSGGVDTRWVLEEALGELSKAHRMVVELWLEGYSAEETAAKVNNELGDALDKPMTESNAHKICSRFRKHLDELLDEGND